jgi:hypothetical protein
VSLPGLKNELVDVQLHRACVDAPRHDLGREIVGPVQSQDDPALNLLGNRLETLVVELRP